MRKQHALVIGAGIGGIATAIRMAQNGFQVTVVENANAPGDAAISSRKTVTASIPDRPCS